MISVSQFRSEVVEPALRYLHPLVPWSQVAEDLLVGTAIVESNLSALRQFGGPALGLFQVEPATHLDVWRNYLRFRPSLYQRVAGLTSKRSEVIGDYLGDLVSNLVYSAAIARVVYFRRPDPLPAKSDAALLAAYWKRNYNTSLGRGEIDARTLRAFQRATMEVTQ